MISEFLNYSNEFLSSSELTLVVKANNGTAHFFELKTQNPTDFNEFIANSGYKAKVISRVPFQTPTHAFYIVQIDINKEKNEETIDSTEPGSSDCSD